MNDEIKEKLNLNDKKFFIIEGIYVKDVKIVFVMY
jgi:hypothetical protein